MKKVHDSYMAFKTTHDKWAGVSEAVYHRQNSRQLLRGLTPRATYAGPRGTPQADAAALSRVVSAASPRGSALALVFYGLQRAAALFLPHRLGVVSGTRMASARASCPDLHELQHAAGRAISASTSSMSASRRRRKRIVDFVSSPLILAVAGVLLKLRWPMCCNPIHRRELPRPGRPSQSLIAEGLIPLGFALVLVQSFSAWLRPRLHPPPCRSRRDDRRSMPLNESLALPACGRVLRLLLIGIPVGPRARRHRLRLRLYRVRRGAVRPVARAHLRRRDQLHAMAIPLFVFMGVMLEKSRLAEDLMEVSAFSPAGSTAAWRSASFWSGCSWAPRPACRRDHGDTRRPHPADAAAPRL